jgi:hypothetical protein
LPDRIFIPLRFLVIGHIGGLVAVQITDDAHYDRSLKWLTDKADFIAAGDSNRNPLKRDVWKAERAKQMGLYNTVERALRMYSQPEQFENEVK